MAEKGSRYARKHAQDEENQNSSQFNFLEEGNFLGVIYNDSDFLDVFNELSMSEQIKAYRILKRLAGYSDSRHLSASDKSLAKNSSHKLDAINKAAGLKIEEKQHYSLSADELHIIRMDCYGTVDVRPRHQLSRFYKDMIDAKMPHKVTLKSYDLDKAPSWQLFRQFSSFRKIEPVIRNYLYQQQVNPEILPVMSVRDFSDLIYRSFRTHDFQSKVYFTTKNRTPRNTFVKTLARRYGREIAKILRKDNLDERYIQSLLNAMRMFGKTDSDKLIIMETHFTPRVLADLQKAGIDTQNYQIGAEIPHKLVEDMINEDKGRLLIARDENGVELKGKDFPSWEIHHIHAVSESGRLVNLAAANYRPNFLMVTSDFHCHVLHGFDLLTVSGTKEAYSRRMELEDPNVTFMYGFDKQQQIIYDWSKEKGFSKQEAEDVNHIVSYEAMMVLLAENRQKYMDNSKSVDFDVDSVVQIIRHKKALEEYGKKNKRNQMTVEDLKRIMKKKEGRIK